MLPAILCGVIAKDRIRKSQGRLTGDGMATAGIVIGSIWAVVIVAVVVLPNLELDDKTSGYTGERKSIATVVDHVQRAFAEDRGEEACSDLFTTAFAGRVARGAGRSCADVVDDAIESGQVQAAIRIDAIAVRGDFAHARVREGSDRQTWRLLKVDRRWLVDAIDTSP